MRAARIDSFDLQPGRTLAGRYVVESFLGSGWEGEVYRVAERTTGVTRAAKLFFPQRNVKDAAVLWYARKLDRLRHCDIVTQYHHSLSIRFRRAEITCLISELVEGKLLANLILAQPGRRLHQFEAMHLLHTLARGLEDIHAAGEYHGDLHADNVLVRRRGIGFDVRLVDFYNQGRSTRERRDDDVCDLIRLFYDSLGGRRRYASQAPHAKAICRGLRRDLIMARFPTVQQLRRHLESFDW